jgi:hypothetical protein
MRRGATLVAAALVAVSAPALAAPPRASADTWCGSESQADRPDTLGGNLVHVAYVVPSDGPDRFQDRAPAIATDLSIISDWWRRQDPTREPRFDFTSVAGCAGRFGQLDITTARTAQPAAAYASPDGRFQRLLSDLPQLINDPEKKYLVYFDSPGGLGGDICGTALPNPRRGSTGVVWLAPNLAGFPGCGSLGDGDYYAKTAAHELIHTLGALDVGAPHPCADAPGHPCDNPADVLNPSGSGVFLSDYVLDFGHDDYYAHSGAWWDVQDSSWLVHLNAGLRRASVTIAGAAGASEVTSDPPGISCPQLCSQDFDSDMEIALSVDADEGVELVGWGGDCSGVGLCALPLGRAASVTATFAPIRFPVVVRVAGRGRVTSRPPGLVSCPGRCRGALSFGTTARLVAKPARGYRFVRWGGDCAGHRACVVDAEATVTALFRR